MKLTLSYDYDCSAETFWTYYFDSDYTTRLHLQALGSTSIEVVELDGDLRSGMERTLRSSQRPDAPGPVKKLFGDQLVTVEKCTFDPATSTSAFTLTPGTLADKTDIRGSIHVVDRTGGCEETFVVDARVKIFGVGPIVERFIEHRARQMQDACVAFLKKELDGR